MPKAKEKVKSAERRHDRGKSSTSEEEDLLVDFWSWEEIKEKLDGTVRAIICSRTHREAAERPWLRAMGNFDTEQNKGTEEEVP